MTNCLKRSLILLLCAVTLGICLFGLPITARAAEEISGTHGDNITWTLSPEGQLTLSGSGEMKTVSTYPWSSYREQITSVVIENGITSVAQNAFGNCSALIRVSLPDSVSDIGRSAFYSCRSLEKIAIPEGVTELPMYLFEYCYALNEVVIPESVTTIGNSAFHYCTSLTKITLPSGLKTMGTNVFDCCRALEEIAIPKSLSTVPKKTFYDCEKLKTVTISEGVTTLGEMAFSGCRKLSAVTLPESLKTISRLAFSGCEALTAIRIPAGTDTIDSSALRSCNNLTSITVDSKNTAYCADARGVLFNKDKTVLLSAPSLSGSYTVPSTVTQISSSAMYGCSFLTDVVLPEGLKRIDDYAFCYCSNLTPPELPASLESIGQWAFEYCYDLDYLVLPQTLSSIEYAAFHRSGLKWVMFTGDLPVLDKSALYDLSIPVYYPLNNRTWTADALQNYGGKPTWLALGSPVGLEVLTQPDRTAYTAGETLDLTGLTVSAKFSNNVLVPLTPESLTVGKCDMSTGGKKSVSLSWNGMKGAFPIAVHVATTTILPESTYPTLSGRYQTGNTQTFCAPGCDKLILEFAQSTQVSNLSVYDRQNTLVKNYSHAFFTDGVTLEVPGDTATLVIEGYESYYDTGYSFTKISAVTLDHAGVPGARQEPTCTDTGFSEGILCDICAQHVRREILPALGHEYKETFVTPENGAYGYTHYDCIRCDHAYDGSYTIADPRDGGAFGDNHTWWLSQDNTLYILGTGDMPADIRSFNLPWYSCRKEIRGVVIGEGVTSICDDAFSNYSNITTASLPLGLTVIGRYAFAGTAITRMDLPDSVVEIGTGAFSDCSKLEEVTLNDGLLYIGLYSFSRCTGLTSITIPGTVKAIVQSAFRDCTNLSRVTFEEAPSKTRSGFTSGLIIETHSFAHCALTSVNLPAHLGAVDGDAFIGNQDLTGIWADTTQMMNGITGPKFKSDSRGCLYEYSYDTEDGFYPYMLVCVPARLSGTYRIPDCVTSVAASFGYCSDLEQLYFGKGYAGVHSLYAYFGCTSLEVLQAGANQEDDSDFFYNDSTGALYNKTSRGVCWLNFVTVNNTEYTVPKEVTNTYYAAFCSAPLKNIFVESGNTVFASHDGVLCTIDGKTLVAYPSGRAASHYVLPRSVTSLDTYAFAFCEDLHDIWLLDNGKPTFFLDCSANTFYGTNVTIHYPDTQDLSTALTEMGLTTGSITFKSYDADKGVCHYVGHKYENGSCEYCSEKEGSLSLAAPTVKLENVSASGQIQLNWTAVEGASQYRIYRSTSKSKGFSRIATTAETSLTDETAAVGTTYYYKVKSVSQDGEDSEYSKTLSGTRRLETPTLEISGDSATGKPKVSWNKVEGAAKYQIYRSTSKSGTYSFLKTTISASRYTDTSAKAGTNYYYKVKAVHEKAAGSSAWSNIVNRVCDLAQPAVSLSVKTATGQPVVKWKTVQGAAKYRVYRAASETDTYELVYTGVSARSYTDADAKAGNEYFYKVKAVHSKSSADSAYSESVSRVCDLPKPVLSISLTSGGSPKVTWKAIDGAEKYQVYRASSKDGTYKLVKTTVSATSFTDKDAKAGKTWYYKVRAVHEVSSATSAYSSIKYIKAK